MTKLAYRMLAVAAAFSIASAANAAAIINPDGSVTLNNNPGSSSFTIDYNGFTSSAQVPVPGLTSSILFNFLGTSANLYNFSYTLSNTSSGEIDASRVTIFGFNTDPNIVGASIGGGDQFNVISAGNQPNGLAAIELCFKDKGPDNNCTGASKGVDKNGSTNGTFSLAFASAVSPVKLSDFSVRYQGIYANGPNLYFKDGSASGLQTVIPEPATWALMIAGFGLVGASLRRRRLPLLTT